MILFLATGPNWDCPEEVGHRSILNHGPFLANLFLKLHLQCYNIVLSNIMYYIIKLMKSLCNNYVNINSHVFNYL